MRQGPWERALSCFCTATLHVGATTVEPYRHSVNSSVEAFTARAVEPLAVRLFGLIQRLDVYGNHGVTPRVVSSIVASTGDDAAGEVE